MKENWYALFVCIVKEDEISIDKSLILMGLNRDNQIGDRKYSKHSDVERKKIYELTTRGKTYSEIAKLLSMSRGQIATIVRQYKLKTARTPTKVVQAAI